MLEQPIFTEPNEAATIAQLGLIFYEVKFQVLFFFKAASQGFSQLTEYETDP